MVHHKIQAYLDTKETHFKVGEDQWIMDQINKISKLDQEVGLEG